MKNYNDRITVLPDEVKKKIAAGEVIEGPFSIIKELMENSVDGGASEIEIQVTGSGLSRIFIKDNGRGIIKEDMPLSIVEHATSKINDIFDIENISTFGFRGEALSSISSVSELTILSRRAEDETGAKLKSTADGVEITDYAGPAGTAVIVENLFYNIPARKKFLKSLSYEMRQIRNIFLKTAISNPQISFSLDSDGKRQITLKKTETITERLTQIFGNAETDSLIFAELQDIKVRISGYISKPDKMKTSRNMQYIFINGRPVDYKNLGFLLSKSYEAVALHGTYPAAVIFIEIDPSLVDVNIHPSKREVKLFDQRYIDSLIFKLAEKVLNREHSISLKKNDNNIIDDTLPENRENLINQGRASERGNPGFDFSNISDNSLYSIREDIAQFSQNKTHYKIIGILFKTYILIEEGDSLVIIDFHAAHERIIYDKLVSRKTDLTRQTLLFPVIVELPIDEYMTAIENLKFFLDSGIEIDDLSDNRVSVKTMPSILKEKDPEFILKEIICYLNNELTPDIFKAVSSVSACRSARKAGDELSLNETAIIADEIFSGSYELRCPHGRPYVYRLDKFDLEKIFKR